MTTSRRRGILIAIGFGIGFYFLGYCLLMERNCSALKKGIPKFRSCYRWAPDADILGSPITITVGEVTFFNYILYPMDMAYYPFVDWLNRKEDRK